MNTRNFIIAFSIFGALVIFWILKTNMAPTIAPMPKISKVGELQKEAIPAEKRPGFKPAPEFSLKDLSGSEIKLTDFRNRVVLINFWATWCPPCREEMPDFISLYEQYKDRGLEIVGISMDWGPERVLPGFIKENNINYRILLGSEEVYSLYGGVNVIPTTFLLDKEGNIRKKYLGYSGKEILENDIKELL